MRRETWLACGLALCLTASSHADARADFIEAAGQQKAQHWAEAAQAYAKVTAQSPAYAPAWKQLASCRYYLGDLEGAEASAARYLKLQPGDSSFAAWDGQLRTKLKLPPLELNGPAPTPMPTALPIDGAITVAMPAPGADAELVGGAVGAPAAGAVTPAPAAEAASPVVPASTPAALQAQLVEEPGAAASAPQSTGPGFGLRLAGSFSLGLGHFEHGEQVNSSSAPSDKAYPGQAGMGVGGLAELLYAPGGLFEFSFGAYPIAWSETQSSSQTDSVTRSNESTAKGLILPLLLGVGGRFPLSPLITGILSVGLGVVPSAHVEVEDSTVQTSSNSLTNTRVKASGDYGLAPAWRLAAGMDVALSSHASAYLGAQVLGAQFSGAEGTASFEVLDQSGATLASGSGLKTKSQALNVLGAGALVGLSYRF